MIDGDEAHAAAAAGDCVDACGVLILGGGACDWKNARCGSESKTLAGGVEKVSTSEMAGQVDRS